MHSFEQQMSEMTVFVLKASFPRITTLIVANGSRDVLTVQAWLARRLPACSHDFINSTIHTKSADRPISQLQESVHCTSCIQVRAGFSAVPCTSEPTSTSPPTATIPSPTMPSATFPLDPTLTDSDTNDSDFAASLSVSDTEGSSSDEDGKATKKRKRAGDDEALASGDEGIVESGKRKKKRKHKKGKGKSRDVEGQEVEGESEEGVGARLRRRREGKGER